MKNNRPWLGETGVASWGKPRLKNSSSKQIGLLIKEFEVSPSDAKPFLKELAQNIGNYDARLKLREASKPAEVRKNIKSARSALKDYSQSLARLDGNSWQILNEYDANSQAVLRGHISYAMELFNSANKEAQSLPKRGALPDSSRLYLAVDVAYAVRKLLHSRMRKKRGGVTLYNNVLAVVLMEANGVEANDVSRLARLARKAVKDGRPDGVVEYLLPSD